MVNVSPLGLTFVIIRLLRRSSHDSRLARKDQTGIDLCLKVAERSANQPSTDGRSERCPARLLQQCRGIRAEEDA